MSMGDNGHGWKGLDNWPTGRAFAGREDTYRLKSRSQQIVLYGLRVKILGDTFPRLIQQLSLYLCPGPKLHHTPIWACKLGRTCEEN